MVFPIDHVVPGRPKASRERVRRGNPRDTVAGFLQLPWDRTEAVSASVPRPVGMERRAMCETLKRLQLPKRRGRSG